MRQMQFRSLFKSVIIFAFLATLPQSVVAEINWLFQVGGMYRKYYDIDYPTDSWGKTGHPEFSAGLYLQIPLSKKTPLFIETGLGYHNMYVLSEDESYIFDPNEYLESWKKDIWAEATVNGHFIELPIKLGYNLSLNSKNAFLFGLGAYGSAAVSAGPGADLWSVGLTASATFRHRCMSFGFSYQNPVFLDQTHNYYKNSYQFTVGINFSMGGVDWDAVADGLGAASVALGAAADSYSQYQNMRQGNSGTSYNSGGSSYSSSSSSSGSSRGSSDGNGFSASEQQAYNRDKATYADYDSELSKYFNGLNPGYDKNYAQRKMREIRERWERRGYSWTKLPNETR